MGERVGEREQGRGRGLLLWRGRSESYRRLKATTRSSEEEGGVVEGLKLGTCPHNLTSRGTTLGCLAVSKAAITTRYLRIPMLLLNGPTLLAFLTRQTPWAFVKLFVFALRRGLHCRVVSAAGSGKRV